MRFAYPGYGTTVLAGFYAEWSRSRDELNELEHLERQAEQGSAGDSVS